MHVRCDSARIRHGFHLVSRREYNLKPGKARLSCKRIVEGYPKFSHIECLRYISMDSRVLGQGVATVVLQTAS